MALTQTPSSRLFYWAFEGVARCQSLLGYALFSTCFSAQSLGPNLIHLCFYTEAFEGVAYCLSLLGYGFFRLVSLFSPKNSICCISALHWGVSRVAHPKGFQTWVLSDLSHLSVRNRHCAATTLMSSNLPVHKISND